jgi:hypothetical protein
MRDDALPVGRLAWAGVAMAAATAIALAVVLAMLQHRRVPPAGIAIDPPPPLAADVPMLQAAPQLDLAAYKDAKLHALHDLGWVDTASGVARVPIETAMAMQVARAASAGASR